MTPQDLKGMPLDEFEPLARNAMEVMLRRGMGVKFYGAEMGWKAHGGDVYYWRLKDAPWHPDPFTAVIEADRWLTEQETSHG